MQTLLDQAFTAELSNAMKMERSLSGANTRIIILPPARSMVVVATHRCPLRSRQGKKT